MQPPAAVPYASPNPRKPAFWLVILLIGAYLIAKRTAAKRFLHGLPLGLLNSVWVTSAHILLFDRYIASHPQEAAMMKSMPMPDSPRLMMALAGPIVGLVSGLILGLFALAAGKLIKGPAERK